MHRFLLILIVQFEFCFLLLKQQLQEEEDETADDSDDSEPNSDNSLDPNKMIWPSRLGAGNGNGNHAKN